MSLVRITNDPKSVWHRLTGGLARRLLFLFLVLSLLPLLLSEAIGYFRSQDIIEALVERYLEGIGELQAHHVADELARHLSDLEGMAASLGPSLLVTAGIPQVERASIEGALRSQLALHSDFQALYLSGSDGETLAAASFTAFVVPDEGRFHPVDSSYYEVVRGIEAPFTPYLELSVPVGEASGEAEVGLYLRATVELGGVAEFLQIPEQLGAGVETILVDELGRPIFISNPQREIDYTVPFETPLIGAPGGTYPRYRDRRGFDVIGTVTPFSTRGWTIIMEVPVESALSELRLLRDLSLWLSAGLALAVIAAAWFVSRGIVAPLQRLLAATRQVKSGDFGSHVEIRDSTEIGALGAAFNEMTLELAQTQSKVEELHRQEIERAGRLATVGELASGVAHEIKNPLSGILSGLDLVSRRTAGDSELSAIVTEMRRALSRIDRAVRDLLAFARPPKLSLGATDLNNVIRSALSLVLPTAESVGVEIELEFAAGDPVIIADGERISQALVNVLMNAVQATESTRGGLVRVTTTTDEFATRIRIEDSGPGLGDDELKEIFRPFFTTKHRGTGLGLSITEGIVARHGGMIEVESAPGQGAVFTVVLPRDQSRSPRTPGASAGERVRAPEEAP